MGGHEYGFRNHVQTSKYHRAAVYYKDGGMPWDQALARARKEWNREMGLTTRRSRVPERGHDRHRSQTPGGVSLWEGKKPDVPSSKSSRQDKAPQQSRSAKSGNTAQPSKKGEAAKKKASKEAEVAKNKKKPATKEESSSSYEEVEADSSDSSSSSKAQSKVKKAEKKAEKPAHSKKPAPPKPQPKAAAKAVSGLENMARLYEAQAAVMRAFAPE